ncbi:MAG: M14 family metallopeptidase [Prevotellaceae bacterium]|nr:M14 family metallopeptidase [Prevotellaceae bacterium]
MKTETLFEMKSPYRDDFRIRGYWFGEGEKAVALVGAMRGDEIQQQYICSRIVALLKEIERRGGMAKDKSVLVIPCCNPFSMNVNRRFWTMDGTDINRMFPGYDKGETTQRIADAIFKNIQGFTYGLQMASFYLPGDFVPHVRMLKTGYEDVEGARLFGLPFVTIRKPLPYDTTLLNYNWQIWNTKAYSIYAGQTRSVEDATSAQTIDAILRFLNKIGVINHRVKTAGYESVLIDEGDLVDITAHDAGIFYRQCGAGSSVSAGERLASILDPYDGTVREEVLSPVDGTVFFAHNKPLALEHGIIFRIQQFD